MDVDVLWYGGRRNSFHEALKFHQLAPEEKVKRRRSLDSPRLTRASSIKQLNHNQADAPIEKFGEKGLGPGQLLGEVSLATDDQGLVYAIDHSVRIQVFRCTTTLLRRRRQNLLRYFEVADPVHNRIKIPLCLLARENTADNNCRDEQYTTACIYAIGPRVYLVKNSGIPMELPQCKRQFQKIAGICSTGLLVLVEDTKVSGAAVLAVVDEPKHGLSLIDVERSIEIGSYYNYGQELGAFRSPTAVCASPHGLLYVSDTLNHRIQAFDAHDLKLQFTFGCKGSSSGRLEYPRQAVIAGDKLCVADWGNHRVQVFTLDGQPLKTIESRADKMWWPHAVAYDRTNSTILVADYWKNCIKRYLV